MDLLQRGDDLLRDVGEELNRSIIPEPQVAPTVVDLTNLRYRSGSPIESNETIVIDDSIIDVPPRPRTNISVAPTEIIDLCSSPADNTQSTNVNSRKRSAIEPIEMLNASQESQHDTSTEKGTRNILKCPICLENVITRRPHTLGCGHIICQDCLVPLMRVNKQCPNCRKPIVKSKVIRIYIDFEN